ncbi:MAG: phosphatase PAP2 family protein [Deltaproteobacteria bacterium]|jgi:acid phosphatase (class A)|nr:phosphatase PAP2 family protein [Deltaproteobacteria bacterium]
MALSLPKKIFAKFATACFCLLLLTAPACGEGFLEPSEIPDSFAFLPPPPQAGSPEYVRDMSVFWLTRAEVGSPRWQEAAFDADIDDNWPEFFAESFGLTISRRLTPATWELLLRLQKDADATAKSAKVAYGRVRPFVLFNQPAGSTCAPGQEKFLRHNGSYPSGHSVLGWSMALLLAEISPERQEPVISRGLDYGFSRVVCGVHWVSDVEAGRTAAAALVIRLHGDPEFAALLDKAKAEISLLRAR